VALLKRHRTRGVARVQAAVGQFLAERALLGLERFDAGRQRVELALLLVAELAAPRRGAASSATRSSASSSRCSL